MTENNGQRQIGSSLGERLRRERRRRKETQAQTAARFGVSQPAYHRWETGQNQPESDRYAQIASYLGFKVEELWQLVHDAAPPLTLATLEERVNELARDIDDLRQVVADVIRALRDVQRG